MQREQEEIRGMDSVLTRGVREVRARQINFGRRSVVAICIDSRFKFKLQDPSPRDKKRIDIEKVTSIP